MKNNIALKNDIRSVFEQLQKGVLSKTDQKIAIQSAISRLRLLELQIENTDTYGVTDTSSTGNPYPLQFAILKALGCGDCCKPLDIRNHVKLQFGEAPGVQPTSTRMYAMRLDGWIVRDENGWSITDTGLARLRDYQEEYAEDRLIQMPMELSNSELREHVQNVLDGTTKSSKQIVRGVEQLAGGTIRPTRVHKAVYDLKKKGRIAQNGTLYNLIESDDSDDIDVRDVPVDQIIQRVLMTGEKSLGELVQVCNEEYQENLSADSVRKIVTYLVDKNKISCDGAVYSLN